MKFKLMAVMVLSSMFLALAALPASARDIGVFTGSAQVCGTPVGGKTVTGPCQGLYAPGGDALRGAGMNPAKYTNRTGTWQFSSTDCSKVNPQHAAEGVVPCSISANGLLGPVGPIGASCGISTGHSGTGTYTAANGSSATLSGVGWVTSAGGTLPITGSYSGTPKSGKPSSGTLVGVVQAQGGTACIKSPATGEGGASNFSVVGVFAQV